MPSPSLKVALITPFSWGLPSPVNQHVVLLARELRARGHRPVLLVSSDDPVELERMRLLARRRSELSMELVPDWSPGDPPDPRLLPRQGTGPLSPEDGVPVVPLGRSFPLRLNGSVANVGLPVDLLSRLERLLMGGGFDVVHVHEPIAPSLSFTAIREARSPVVSTFHLTPVGLLGYELGQSLLQPFYVRLDGRVVTTRQAAEVLAGSFPGDYRVIPGGTSLALDAPAPADVAGPAASPFALYVYRGDDRRGLRALLRTLAGGAMAGFERLVVAVHRPSADRWPPRTAPRSLRNRVEWLEFDEVAELAPAYARAGATILPFLGGEWLLTTCAEALCCGSPVVAPDLPVTRELVDPEQGRLFSPDWEPSLRAALEAALSEAPEARPARAGRARAGHHPGRVADQVLELYEEVSDRPGTGAGVGGPGRVPVVRQVPRRPLRAGKGWIHADLHIHTSHSKDCTSPVEAVLTTARDVGLSAIAIADHNVISGALEARERAASLPGAPAVIVAEEVMTRQGEVIGLFLEEVIPAGLTFDETLARIKEQGGLVYVPHPFDRLHRTPSYRCLVDNLHRLDVIETYNARLTLSSFNLNAERFAAKYNLVGGAGSDAHVLPGIGTAMLAMPCFEGPEEFMAALREADILARRRSLLYLQSLKLLRTTLDHVLPGA